MLQRLLIYRIVHLTPRLIRYGKCSREMIVRPQVSACRTELICIMLCPHCHETDWRCVLRFRTLTLTGRLVSVKPVLCSRSLPRSAVALRQSAFLHSPLLVASSTPVTPGLSTIGLLSCSPLCDKHRNNYSSRAPPLLCNSYTACIQGFPSDNQFNQERQVQS